MEDHSVADGPLLDAQQAEYPVPEREAGLIDDSGDAEKLAILQALLRKLSVDGRLALAFSGGLDSRFLAYSAWIAGLSPLLLHGTGPHISTRESEHARSWASGRGLEFHSFEVNPLILPQVAVNDTRRCYYCKTALFRRLKQEAEGLPLCDGTQASDTQGYRPGLAALQELEIRSPLARAGLDKPGIRRLAARSGLDNPLQKPRPCLLTRLAYGQRPSPELLAALDRGEQAAEELLRAWSADRGAEKGLVPDFRLRQIREGVIELHMAPLPPLLNPEEGAPAPLVRALTQSIRDSAGLVVSALVLMPGLSGYFDQKQL